MTLYGRGEDQAQERMGSWKQLCGSVESTRGERTFGRMSCLKCVSLTLSELASPLSAISSILSPNLAESTSPTLISFSLHAVAKIFGSYAANISSAWSQDVHSEAKNLVTSIKTGLQPFQSSPDIEIHERAVEITSLLSFVEADLASHRTLPKSSHAEQIPGMEGGFESSSSSSGNPPYPKSLFLFQPLFTSHELNAVASSAQSFVRVPEGLNLDGEIVPGGGFGNVVDDDIESEEEEKGLDLGEGGGAGMEELRRVLREQGKDLGKKKKGKGKGKGKTVDGETMMLEERADRQRVSQVVPLHLASWRKRSQN